MVNHINVLDRLDSKVLFFRKGKSYYFLYDNRVHKCNIVNINKLKEQMILPYKISFRGFSKAQLGRVLSSFVDESLTVIYRKANTDKDNILRFDAVFYEREKTITKKYWNKVDF